MLKEIKPTLQVQGEPFRRWYTDGSMELIVWISRASELIGFQLILPQEGEQKVVTWQLGKGFSFDRVDDGEGRPGRPKMSPILIEDNSIDVELAIRAFSKVSQEVPAAGLIEARLRELKEQGITLDEGTHPGA